MEAKKIKNIVIEIVRGDITKSEAEALVNAANNEMRMGSGVAGAIKAKGGVEIEKEALSKGPVETGGALATPAGRLAAKYIIHAAVMGADFKTNENYIAAATANSLKLAEKLKVGSVCFPALGTGVGRFPLDECAEIMFNETVKFGKTGPKTLKRAEFALFSEKAFAEFEKKYREL